MFYNSTSQCLTEMCRDSFTIGQQRLLSYSISTISVYVESRGEIQTMSMVHVGGGWQNLRLTVWFLWGRLWGWMGSLTGERAWAWELLHSCSWAPEAEVVWGDSSFVWFSLSAGGDTNMEHQAEATMMHGFYGESVFWVYPMEENVRKKMMTQN